MTRGEASQQDDTLVRDAARDWAPDYYITALLAPADLRDDLVTLAAFWGDTGRVALTVGEDMLGEIRLQWWRDALLPSAAASGHPIADAMRAVIEKRKLDAGDVDGLLDARCEELRRLPFESEAGFDGYLARTDGALLRLAASIRGLHVIEPQNDLLITAARALGRVRIALDLPYLASRSRLPLWQGALGYDYDPQEAAGRSAEGAQAMQELVRGARAALTNVRTAAQRVDRRLIDAMLPIALMEPYLRALETKGRDPLRDIAAISPFSRVARLTWAHVRGRF
ncbi:MAG: squalene/phytoene synthase family protein [Hyphomicrobiaceae bacterium]|nr:squalene/phytoene synthase family protein [Hyphomicrobiaceae bacterium]